VEVEAAGVTVRAGAGFACGAGSGAGPPDFFGAGSGVGPPAVAGAAQVAKRARHATSTSARRGSILLLLRDPPDSTSSPPMVNWDGLPSAAMCQTRHGPAQSRSGRRTLRRNLVLQNQTARNPR
jgi:hypothetical protein